MSCLKHFNFDDFDVNCGVNFEGSRAPPSLLTLAGTHHTHPTMSATACPIAIKVHVHSGYCRSKLPPVAARLQAREKPERKAVSDEVRDAYGFFSRRANV